jgi:hypothetical protein
VFAALNINFYVKKRIKEKRNTLSFTENKVAEDGRLKKKANISEAHESITHHE